MDSTAFQTLERGYEYLDSVDGYIAYRDTGRAFVTAGPPVAAPHGAASLARYFCDQSRSQGRRVAFFGVGGDFVRRTGLRSVPIGIEPFWTPSGWLRALGRRSSLRAQLGRARRKGVHVHEGAPLPPRAAEYTALIELWLASRRMAPLGFLAQLDPFVFSGARVYLEARHRHTLLGLLVACPIVARGGWFIQHVFRAPSAPNGTAEILIDGLMRRVVNQGPDVPISMGLAPLAGPVPWWLGAARRLGQPLYNFSGLHAFKAKLEPTRWQRRYLAYPQPQRAPATVVDALRAFAEVPLHRFGLHTIESFVARSGHSLTLTNPFLPRSFM